MKKIIERIAKVNSVHLMAIQAVISKFPKSKITFEEGEITVEVSDAVFVRVNPEKLTKIISELAKQGQDIYSAFSNDDDATK